MVFKDKVVANLRIQRKILEDKLKAIEKYLNELEGTGNFVDKRKIMNIIKGDEEEEEK